MASPQTRNLFRKQFLKIKSNFFSQNYKFSATTSEQKSELLNTVEYSKKLVSADVKGIKVWRNFINEKTEELIVSEIDKKWQRLSYQKGHWDHAIQDYRELEIQNWSKTVASVINSMKSTAFKVEDKTLLATHVLDLAPQGFIKPHVDSVRFCGRAITGLNLLSSSVMKFVKVDDEDKWFKVLLPRRSLYVMEDDIRYNYTHEILKTEFSYINNEHINKERRISVLCRTEAKQQKDDIFRPTFISLDP